MQKRAWLFPMLAALFALGGACQGSTAQTPCESNADCEGDQQCVDKVCQQATCGADKPFLIPGAKHWTVACAECRVDDDCPSDERCSSETNEGFGATTRRCVPRIGCDADDQCGLEEICVSNECVSGAISAECNAYWDCQDDENCEDGRCQKLECEHIGASEWGRFCESCGNDNDCPEGQICKYWDHYSVYPVPGSCVEPGCNVEEDCGLFEICVDGECVNPDAQ